MSYNPEIHALLEERASRAGAEWNIERAPALPAPEANFRIQLNLQMGPIFITIGSKMANEACSPTQFVKEIA